jgi:hypothetical protein
MAMFEPTKGLGVIACDECAETSVIPADVLHIADKETYQKVLNGEIELKAKVVEGRLVLQVPEESGDSEGG